MLSEFDRFYEIMEAKLAEKQYDNEPIEPAEKERKKPKLRQNQIFYGTKNYKKSSK